MNVNEGDYPKENMHRSRLQRNSTISFHSFASSHQIFVHHRYILIDTMLQSTMSAPADRVLTLSGRLHP